VAQLPVLAHDRATLGFARIVHIESDAFLLSRRIVDRFNALDDGWTAFWFPAYGVPEPALQVIADDQFDAMASFAARSLDDLTQDLARTCFRSRGSSAISRATATARCAGASRDTPTTRAR
jgi:hypothetical protein